MHITFSYVVVMIYIRQSSVTYGEMPKMDGDETAFSTNYVGNSGTPLTIRLFVFLKNEYVEGAQ